MKLSQTELQSLGNRMTNVVTAKVNRILSAAEESLRENLTEYDLDQLLKEIEQELSENSGIEAVFYPL